MDDYLLYGVLGLIFICFVLLIIEHFRLGGMIKKYRRLINGLSDKNVEDLMMDYSSEMDKVKKELSGTIENRLVDLEKRMPSCLRNVGMVSFNAFENMGNNMSFSLAALDDKKNGCVLTGLYTRENSYVYLKQIIDGQPQKDLSKEEKDALSKALSFMK